VHDIGTLSNGDGNGNGVNGNGHNGNGHNGNGHDRSGALTDLLERTNGDPLWKRLPTGPTNGTHAPTRPDLRVVEPAGPDERPARGLRALLARVRASRAADVVALLPVVVGVALVQFVNLPHWPEPFFDEGTYVSNAWAVQRHGALSNYTYGYGHPPLGWLAVSLWTWVTHFFGNSVYSVATGRELMAGLTVVSCLLLYVLARRLGIGRPFAAAAVALFAFSPVALYFHRLVLIDNPAVMFALGAFVLATSPRRRLWTFAASGACFAAAVLSKESMLVLLPVFVYLAVQNSDRRTRRYCLTFVGSFAALVLLIYPLYALLKGELFPGQGHVSLLGEAGIQLFSRRATGSLFDAHSGTYNTVHDWLHLDPWLLGGALVLSPIALMRRTTRAVTLAFLVQCAILLRPGYLPYMYVIGLLPFAALVVAGVADSLWRFAMKGRQDAVDHRARWRAIMARASRRMSPVTRTTAAVGLGMLVAASAVVVGPRWVKADRASMTLRLDGPQRAAQQWLVRNVDHSKRLLVNDDTWVHLIEHGFDARPMKGGFYSRTVMFYWSFDFDPAVRPLVPQGWRNFDYVVVTQGMRNDIRDKQVPQTAQAVEHSRLVAGFGEGWLRIEIRAVDGHITAPLNPPRDATKKS
jgi:4-amino-4-deoxy-L-arabinose transferase-like glycosyltransferase